MKKQFSPRARHARCVVAMFLHSRGYTLSEIGEVLKICTQQVRELECKWSRTSFLQPVPKNFRALVQPQNVVEKFLVKGGAQ